MWLKTLATKHTHTQPFNGPWSGNTRVGRYQKKHSPTHTHPDHRTSFINFLHLLRSIASSVFSLHAWQSSLIVSYHLVPNIHPIKTVATGFIVGNKCDSVTVYKPNFALVEVRLWHVWLYDISQPTKSAQWLIHTCQVPCMQQPAYHGRTIYCVPIKKS